MNCQTFQNIVGDLARDGLIEASVRQDGLTHAGECADCEVRLTAERQLDVGLKGLAQADSTLVAPVKIEAALLQAFRSRHVESSPITSVNETVAPLARRSYPWYTGAIAASVAMMLAAGFMWIKVRPPVEQPPATYANNGEGNDHGSPNPEPEHAVIPENGLIQETGPSEQSSVNVPMKTASNRRRSFGSQRSAFINPNELVAKDIRPPEEIMTDFIPVSFAGTLPQVENGRLVRVEMPRSALASFGLSVNALQANERVKADVLMDEFGTAQAVRFVK